MYSYKEEKKELFSEENQKLFLAIRDQVKRKLKISGAIDMAPAIDQTSGCSWMMMACVDRMLELGELREITTENTMGQYRIFVEA